MSERTGAVSTGGAYSYWGGVEDADAPAPTPEPIKPDDDHARNILGAIDRIVRVCDDVRVVAEKLEPAVHAAMARAQTADDKDFVRDVAALIALIKLHL